MELTTKVTKHALSKAEGSAKFEKFDFASPVPFVVRISRLLFSRLADQDH